MHFVQFKEFLARMLNAHILVSFLQGNGGTSYGHGIRNPTIGRNDRKREK